MPSQTQQAITLLDTLVKQNGALVEALSAIQGLYGGDTTATLAAIKSAIASIAESTSDSAVSEGLQNLQNDIDALEVLIGDTSDTRDDATVFGKFAAIIYSLSSLATKQDIAGLAEKTDLEALATAQNVTDAKNEILAALPQEATEQEIDELFPSES